MDDSTIPNSPSESHAIDSISENLATLSIPQPDEAQTVKDDHQLTKNDVEIIIHEEIQVNSNYSNDGDGDDSKEVIIRRYPVREEAEECAYYIKTGLCKFGFMCKFNHPQGVKVNGEEKFDSAPESVKEKGEYVMNQRRIYCKYFDRPGGCKYGKACKFNHSRKASPASELNFLGLPIRQGEKECPYYIRNGACKYGTSCRFNHPDPTSVVGLDALPSHINKGSMSSPSASQSILKSRSRAALNETPAYVPLMYPPTQGLLPRPEWTPYQAPAYLPGVVRMAAPYAMNRQPSERNVNPHQHEQILGDEFPERPGQPECSFFLKTGNCKYRSACKFHHPKDASGVSPPYSLSELGLPLRPGEDTCSYYSRYGICKYGPACKYDHPINHAHSALDMSPGIGNNHAMAAGS